MSVIAPRIQKPAPAFKLDSLEADGQFGTRSLADYAGKYLVVIFYPLDFTFVCPTEIIAFSDRYNDFKKRNTEVCVVSVDSKYSHLAWVSVCLCFVFCIVHPIALKTTKSSQTRKNLELFSFAFIFFVRIFRHTEDSMLDNDSCFSCHLIIVKRRREEEKKEREILVSCYIVYNHLIEISFHF
jgi:hypothetical protein